MAAGIKTFLEGAEITSYTFKKHNQGNNVKITVNTYGISNLVLDTTLETPYWLTASLSNNILTLSLTEDIYDYVSWDLTLVGDGVVKKTLSVSHEGLTVEQKEELGIPYMEGIFDYTAAYNYTGPVNKVINFVNAKTVPQVYAWYSSNNNRYRVVRAIITTGRLMYTANVIGENYLAPYTETITVCCSTTTNDDKPIKIWQQFNLYKGERGKDVIWRGGKELVAIGNTPSIDASQTTVTIPLYVDDSVLSLSNITLGHQTSDVIENVRYRDNFKDIVVTVKPNTNSQMKYSYFTISGELTNATGTIQFETDYSTIIQRPAPISMDLYTMKDFVYRYFPQYTYNVVYRIFSDDDTIIYQGKCYINDGYCEIYLNDILKDYIKPNVSLTEDSKSGGAKKFKLEIGRMDNNTFSVFDEIDLNVYNYYLLFGEENEYFLNLPIQNVCTNGQYLQCSIRKKFDDTRDLDTFFSAEGSRTPYKNVESGDNNYLHIVNQNSDVFYYVEGYRYSRYIQFKNVNACQYNLEYEIIYKNPLGGYDNVLFLSQSKQTDNIADNPITINRFNSDIRGNKFNIDRTITRNWNLKTMRLTKDEASRLPYLFESNELYLHKLGTNEFIPVLITDKKAEYVNAATKKQQYRINVEEARSYSIR